MAPSAKEMAPSLYITAVWALIGALTCTTIVFFPGEISDGTDDASMLFFAAYVTDKPQTWDAASQVTSTSSPVPDFVVNTTIPDVKGHARFNVPNGDIASASDAELKRHHEIFNDDTISRAKRFLSKAQMSLKYVTEELDSTLYGSDVAYTRNVELHTQHVKHLQGEVDAIEALGNETLGMFHSMQASVVFGLLATLFMVTALGSLLSKHQMPMEVSVLLSGSTGCLLLSGIIFAVYYDHALEVVHETTQFCSANARQLIHEAEIARIKLDNSAAPGETEDCRFITRFYAKTVLIWLAVGLVAISAICTEAYRRLDRVHSLSAPPAKLVDTSTEAGIHTTDDADGERVETSQ